MEIDFYPASRNVLLILTGRCGSTKGYKNKYVTIAKNINRKYNFSVFVAGIPENCWQEHQQVFCDIIDYVFMHIKPNIFYVMGSSAGANLAIWYAYLFPKINKVLAINPVLNFNLHKTLDGINNFGGERLYVISGGKDPCVKWQGLLPKNDKLYAIIIERADHHFTDMIDEFIKLPGMLFMKSSEN